MIHEKRVINKNVKKLIPVFMALILSFLMVSCLEAPKDDPYHGRLSRNFWAQNMDTSVFYKLDAVKLAEGKKCIIWVEKSTRVSIETAENIAREYDNNIYQKMMTVFGTTGDIYSENKIVAHNTLELADWLGDGDGKLSILLLDIKDGYRKTGDSYVAGYFWLGNFYKIDYSNQMDMIYVDAKPSVPGSVTSNITFAHELQHLMNFATSTTIPGRINHPMDTWINEGLSSAAEYVYLAPNHAADHISFFTTDPTGTIARGNNFFVWGNHSENPLSILDDYATVYLFFQWLRLQSNGTGIYKDITTSLYYDYRAVTTAAAARIDGNYNYWETLLRDWLAANYINAPSGPYGYKNDPAITNGLRVKYLIGGTSIPLYPGEGVYSYAGGGGSLPGSGSKIKYTGLTSSGLNGSVIPAGGALLTYNTNTSISGTTETGQLTNKTPPPAVSINADTAMSRSAAPVSGPYVIDAQDMLRRNGHEGWEIPNFGALALPKVEINAAK
jgi:hypothetical protein